jgi:hypothetical protein
MSEFLRASAAAGAACGTPEPASNTAPPSTELEQLQAEVGKLREEVGTLRESHASCCSRTRLKTTHYASMSIRARNCRRHSPGKVSASRRRLSEVAFMVGGMPPYQPTLTAQQPAASRCAGTVDPGSTVT